MSVNSPSFPSLASVRFLLCVIGLIAHTCIEATVRFAAELGYEVTVIRDATADYTDEMMHAALDINLPNYANAIMEGARPRAPRTGLHGGQSRTLHLICPELRETTDREDTIPRQNILKISSLGDWTSN